MKKIFAVSLLGLSLLASCGVDKDGTADNLIKELEKSGMTFTDDQRVCVKQAVTSFSDEELRSLSDQKASEELQASFLDKLLGCDIGG